MFNAISPTIYGLSFQFGQALGNWLVGGNDNSAAAAAAAAQQQAYLAELQKMREEAERQRLLAEQRRVQAIFDRLSHELMGIDKSPNLELMGIDKSPDLKLMGIDNGPGLQLMLGDSSSSTPNSNAVGSKPQLVDNSDGNSTNPCTLTDVPGLPGADLCNHTSAFLSNGNPIQLAKAAQSLSGPEQVVVEDSALHAAETKPELMSQSQDPQITSFQAADADYQKAQQAQGQAAQANDQARQEYESAADALKTAQSEVASHQAAGAPPPSPALQQALGDLSNAAKTDEAASVRAQQQFDALNADLTVKRTKAVGSLAAVIPPPTDASVVDLRDKRQPLVPQNLGPNAGPGTTNSAASTMGPAGLPGLSAPGSPIFDCKGDRAAVSRLLAGLPVQEDAIQQTEKALLAATNDHAEAREEAALAAIRTLNSAAISISDWSEHEIARQEGPKAHGIPVDVAARIKFLEKVKKIAELSNRLAKETELVPKADAAGKVFGTAVYVEKTARSLVEQEDAMQQMLQDSGLRDELLEEAGAKASRFLGGPVWGPLAEAAFHTLVDSIDCLAHSAQAWNSAAEVKQAEQSLEQMRSQLVRIRARVFELKQEVAQGCSNTKTTADSN
jgi:hypothetical protein